MIWNLIPDGDLLTSENGMVNSMVPSNGPLMVGLELKDSNNNGMNFSDYPSINPQPVMPNSSEIDL